MNQILKVTGQWKNTFSKLTIQAECCSNAFIDRFEQYRVYSRRGYVFELSKRNNNNKMTNVEKIGQLYKNMQDLVLFE